MNVVLADRGKDSDENESTNGLGKTTLLRIVQFCLGSDIARDRVLTHPDLANTTFGIDLVIDGETLSVRRNTTSADVIYASGDFVQSAGLERDVEPDGFAAIDLDIFRNSLSRLLLDSKGDAFTKAFPSFRDLSYYFIRIGKDAYVDPQTAYRNQSGPSKRISVSYLLDLNWPVQRELQELTKARTSVQSALTALGDAADASGDRSIGDLEAERVVLEKMLKERQGEVENFNLRSDYHDLESKLFEVDRTLHELVNANYSDRRLLKYYEDSASEAPLFDAAAPISILMDAGAIFKTEALRSLEDVSLFHKQLYQNRTQFLADEIRRLRAQVNSRNALIADETKQKSSVMRVLSSSGALETLIEIQRKSTEIGASLEALKARIDERKRFDRRKDQLTAEIAASRSLLKRDLEDRREGIDEAIVLFAEYSAFLYGVAGKLGVDVSNSGYRFTFTIDRQGSDGVDQMVVFCFDLVVATLRARRGARFLSLVHDSTLFADVDPRQYGLALQLAAKTSASEGFQYICCLNAGALPTAQLGELTLEDYVRLRLTDDNEAGRLLGRRLAPRE
ncbi:DUF2326 domain-containing protein [Mesorhizobium sp. M1365]|uniref:DUF2326 domain-containing protein n=1 Tax=Mesorhizobium sp. M1365 TaxID=2957090 RepID=UPI003336BE61